VVQGVPQASGVNLLEPIAPRLVVKVADDLENVTIQLNEAQKNMQLHLENMTMTRADIGNDSKGGDGEGESELDLFVLDSVLEQTKQQLLLEMNVVSRLLSLTDWTSSASQSEITTLASCFVYKPYLNTADIGTVLALG
jgi:hypothetical protein